MQLALPLFLLCALLVQHVTADVIEVFYYSSWSPAYIYYSTDYGSTWPLKEPGMAMKDAPESSGFGKEYKYAKIRASSLKFALNNGHGNWDSRGGSDYVINEPGTYSIRKGSLIKEHRDPLPPPSYAVTETNLVDCQDGQEGCMEGNMNCSGDCEDEVKDLYFAVTSAQEKEINIQIKSRTEARWEVPPRKRQEAKNVHQFGPSTDSEQHASHSPFVTFSHNPFQLVVNRGDFSQVFSLESFSFLDRDIQFTLTLPNKDTAANYVYGWGTRKGMLRLDANPHRSGYTIYNGDAFAAGNGESTYGSHPFLLIKDNDGSWYGVFLLNSNANDIKFEEGGKLAFRLSGGIIDLQVFLGPTAKEVLAQYHNHIGLPMLPPMWSLGYHQCQWGYADGRSVLHELERHHELNIPLDGLWNDIDYMDNYKDFTLAPAYNKELMDQIIGTAHERGQHVIFIKDPVIAIDDTYEPFWKGKEADIFIKDFYGDNDLVAKQWPGLVHVPDFYNPKTLQYWTQMLSEFHDLAAFDGIWLDMNEPSNFCSGSYFITNDMDLNGGFPWECHIERYHLSPMQVTQPGFILQEQQHVEDLNRKMLSTDAKSYDGNTMYNLHNLFGDAESRQTHDALISILGKRPFVLTRDSFAGTGQVAAHWTGDELSNWDVMRSSIDSILSMQLFGMPMTGSDIPGLDGKPTPELFVRWMQLGSFYPFMRNHHDVHDSTKITSMINWDETTRNRALRAIRVRYSLLPLWYTNFYLAHSRGGGVVQPLFMEFRDDASLDVTNAFLIGEQLMVAPALYEGQKQVNIYMPAASRWFDFQYGTEITWQDPQYLRALYPASLDDDVPLFIRGGCIVPSQEPALTAMAAFETPMTLTVAMNRDGKATGQMFHDDGEALDSAEMDKHNFMEFVAEVAEGKLTVRSSVLSENPDHRMERSLKVIRVYGLANNNDMHCGFLGSTPSYNEVNWTKMTEEGVALLTFSGDFHFGAQWTIECASTSETQ